MSRSRKGMLVGMWLLMIMVMVIVTIVILLDNVLGNPVMSFVYKTVLRSPARIRADVKAHIRHQDIGRNVTALMLMKKESQSYGHVIATRASANIDETEPNSIAEVISTLELLKLNMSLHNHEGDMIWEHGKTFKDSEWTDIALPGLEIGRLSIQ